MLERLSPSWLVLSEGFRKDVLVMFTKRVLDVLISAAGPVIVFPITFFLQPPRFYSSRGVLFCFVRNVLDYTGAAFSILKFRSMKQDAEEGKAIWATRDDPRVTRVGRIIAPFPT